MLSQYPKPALSLVACQLTSAISSYCYMLPVSSFVTHRVQYILHSRQQKAIGNMSSVAYICSQTKIDMYEQQGVFAGP